jgi:hypothetical protein
MRTAVEDVEQSRQSDSAWCEVTRTSTSSGVSLMEVMREPLRQWKQQGGWHPLPPPTRFFEVRQVHGNVPAIHQKLGCPKSTLALTHPSDALIKYARIVAACVAMGG